jgi:hypothetical protein
MLQLVIIVIAFVGLAVASRLAWSSSAKEKRYMAQHRRAMETISKLSDAASEQSEPPRFKVEPLRPPRLDLSRLDDLTDPDLIRIEAPLRGAPTHDSPSEPPPSEPPLDDTARIERALFPSELVFGEDETLAGAPSNATEVMPRVLEGDRGGRRIYRSGGRSIPLSVMALGLGAVAVLLGVGFFVLSGGTRTSAPTSAQRPADTSTGVRGSGMSTTGSHRTSGAKSSTKKSSTKKSSTKKSSTKRTTLTLLTPSQSTAQTATFNVPGGVKTVVVAATGAPCWVAESASPNGPILWDQTLAAGTSYTIHSSTPSLWIRVGNSHDFAMVVNGVRTRFTSPPGPFDFDLVGS